MFLKLIKRVTKRLYSVLLIFLQVILGVHFMYEGDFYLSSLN